MSDYEPFVPEQTEKSIAVYPGTFDPITMGHIDIINRGLTLFDKVIIAVAQNVSKKPLFSIGERLEMIRESFPDRGERITVDTVDGLLVDYAYTRGAKAIIRGLRA
ncbi:MAG: pantetheine-phosphate adenylyltransferase, partial [Desulfurivibrionaceae bacterium]